MTKKLLTFLTLLTLFTTAWAASITPKDASTAKTGTIKFGSADGSVEINATSVTGNDDLGNSWTITSVFTNSSSTSFTQNASYSQVGAGRGKDAKTVSSITFTTTLPKEVNITKLEAKFGGFSDTKGDVTLKVGDTSVGTGALDKTTDVTVTSKENLSQKGTELTVTVTNTNRLKCYYISYTYEEVAQEPSITVSPNPIELKAVLNGSASQEVTVTYANLEYGVSVFIDQNENDNVFSLSPDGNYANVSGSGKLTYTITYNPTSGSSHSASLDFLYKNDYLSKTKITGTVVNPRYTVTPAGEISGGTFTYDPETAPYEGVEEGEVVTITAVPNDGYVFNNDFVFTPESVENLGENDKAEFFMPAANVTFTASFSPKDLSITVDPSTNGSVTVSPAAGPYHVGDEITLTITPDDGYVLNTLTVHDGNANNVTVTDNKFTMPGSDVTIGATFNVAPVAPGTPSRKLYQRITSTNDLVAGEKYIIVSQGDYKSSEVTYDFTKAAGAYNTTSNLLGDVDVTISDKQVDLTDVDGVVEFTLSGATDAWYLEFPDGEKLGVGDKKVSKGDGTALKITVDNTDKIEGTVSTTTTTTTTTYSLQYNPNGGNGRFACYTSSQKPIMLFKQVQTLESVLGGTAGSYNITTPVKVLYKKGNTAYVGDGNGNYIAISDADDLQTGEVYTVSGNFNASQTDPVLRLTKSAYSSETVNAAIENYYLGVDPTTVKPSVWTENPKANQVVNFYGYVDGTNPILYGYANHLGRQIPITGDADDLELLQLYCKNSDDKWQVLQVTAAVKLTTPWSSWTTPTDAPRHIQLQEISKDYQNITAEVLDYSDDNTFTLTGITELTGDKAVSAVKYYNLMGVESDRPFDGVNIVVTKFNDGTSQAVKVVK